MSMMNEARRQFVLGVAGVRVWYARKPLPAAAPSPCYEFPEEPAPPLPVDAPPVSARAQSKHEAGGRAGTSRSGEAPASLARIQSLLADGASPKVTVPERLPGAEAGDITLQPLAGPAPVSVPVVGSVPAETAMESPPAGQQLVPVAVHWGFWRAGSWLLVSALTEGASRDLEERLARGILAALGETVVTAVQVRWPVFSNPAVPGGDAGGLAEVLQRIKESAGEPGRVVCLGLLPAADSPQREVLEPLAKSLGDIVFQGEVSLAGLASLPMEKKTLWTALRPLAGKSAAR